MQILQLRAIDSLPQTISNVSELAYCGEIIDLVRLNFFFASNEVCMMEFAICCLCFEYYFGLE